MLKLVVFLVLSAIRSGAVAKHHHSKRVDSTVQPLDFADDGIDFPFPVLQKSPVYAPDESILGLRAEEREDIDNIAPPVVPPSANMTLDEDNNGTVSANVTTVAPATESTSADGVTVSLQSNGNTTHNDDFASSTANSTVDDKEVVIPTTKPPAPYFDSILQQTIARLNDTYTLSILLPVTAGFVFASVVIVSVAICNCVRRRCCKRRFRRKVLPESLRNMRQSDREKLLAETSDEEF